MRLLQTTSFYGLAITLLCLGYLGLQIVGIPTTFLEADEFWFAHHIYEYTHGVPYQDFIPYKTVLGYYLLSLPLYFFHGLITPIYYIKDEIALINTIMIAIAAWWGARIFQPRAVFYSLLVLVSSQMFLLFSSQTRVDMLSSWCCLISILFLVNQRAVLAGLSIGLAFLISQKALWYLTGTDVALGFWWLAGTDYKKDFRTLLAFNFSALTTIVIYILFWSVLANDNEVMRSVFYEGFTQAKVDYYAIATWYYWRFVLQHGPLMVMLLPLTLLPLFEKTVSRQRILLLGYGLLTFALIITYRQFFPYNIVFLLPAFFIIYSEFFSWLQTPGAINISDRALFWFFACTLFAMTEFALIMFLPKIYFVALLIPVLLWRDLSRGRTLRFNSKIAMGAIILLTGVVAPLLTFANMVYFFNGDYQRQNVQIADSLLQDGGSYIAGTLVFADKDLSLDGFKDLIGPALSFARSGDKTLLPALLASLKITPKTSAQMLDDLQNSNLKVIINNPRINALPVPVLTYLRTNYQHYWGSIYLYAPTVAAGKQLFQIKFAGVYTVEGNHSVTIDRVTFIPNAIVNLQEGEHTSQAKEDYRLRLKPTLPVANADLPFRHDCPPCTRLSFNIEDYSKN